MKTKHVEGFSIACMDEGSIPSDSTIYPRELNVFGVLFFFVGSLGGIESAFLALKDVTDPSDLTMFWIMQKSFDCFDRSIPIRIMQGISPRSRPQRINVNLSDVY
jgi:hypothetical protein